MRSDLLSPPAHTLPVRPRLARALVLSAVFLCAACGLVYELALVALGSYLIGNSVTQASIVLSIMVFAMGVGSLAAKGLRHRPAASFAVIELVLALTGGLSVLVLYAAFAWLHFYTPVLVAIVFCIGALIGAEIPLLMTLIQRIRNQDAGEAAADLFAADYVGALLGGLAFPFLLLPLLGQIKGALVVGIVNAVVGALVVLWLFRREIAGLVRLALTGATVAVVIALVAAFALSDSFEVTARQQLFNDPIVYAERSRYQQIVLTRDASLTGQRDLRLYLNGDLQFSSVDEYRYHEALVHPAMAGRHRSVLIIGGGDGLALREVLRYESVREVTLVELDPAVLRLGRTHPALTRLNQHAYDDPRVRTVAADAFTWLRENSRRFDVIITDLPDPDQTALAKLYSVEFYSLVRHALAPRGRLVVQAGSPYFATEAFWCIEESIAAAGLATMPYQVNVPSFGNWGYVLAARSPPRPRLAADAPDLRFLTEATLSAATVFAADVSHRSVRVRPSTLMHPRILEYERHGWRNY